MKYLMIVIMVLMPSIALAKSPQARIAEAFATLKWKQNPNIVIMRTPRQYEFDRAMHYFDQSLRLWIYRECSIDIRQDPGETSCRMVMADI